MEKVLMTPCLLILLHELWSSCIIWSTVKRWISIFRRREMYGHPNLVTFPQERKFHVGTNVKLFPLQPGTFFPSVMTGSSSILAGTEGWKIAALLLKRCGCGFMLMCVSASLTSHMWSSGARSLAVKHLIYSTSASDLGRTSTCNKRQMHFARNWHKYFLRAFRSRYKIFFCDMKIHFRGKREFYVCPLLALDWR